MFSKTHMQLFTVYRNPGLFVSVFFVFIFIFRFVVVGLLPPRALCVRHRRCFCLADAELCGYQPIGISGASAQDKTVEGTQGG